MNNSLNIYNVITSGSYSVSEEKFTCDCLKTGDCFALCDYELSSKKSHVLECEFEKIEAVNGEFGIIFGVLFGKIKKVNSPSAPIVIVNE